MRPQKKSGNLRTIGLVVLVILLAFPIAFLAILYMLITLPYQLYFYSSHWGLQRRDFSPVQLYLNKFEVLHPTLMAYVTQHLNTNNFKNSNLPRTVKFWPTMTKDTSVLFVPFIATITTTAYSFSSATGLFFLLEAAGWPRRQLYDFLQREVESKVNTLTDLEKQHFAKAKDNVCNHNVYQVFMPSAKGTVKEGFELPELGYANNAKVISITGADIDWIVDESYPLVEPMDFKSFNKLAKIRNLLPIWKVIEKGTESLTQERQGWQMLDMK